MLTRRSFKVSSSLACSLCNSLGVAIQQPHVEKDEQEEERRRRRKNDPKNIEEYDLTFCLNPRDDFTCRKCIAISQSRYHWSTLHNFRLRFPFVSLPAQFSSTFIDDHPPLDFFTTTPIPPVPVPVAASSNSAAQEVTSSKQEEDKNGGIQPIFIVEDEHRLERDRQRREEKMRQEITNRPFYEFITENDIHKLPIASYRGAYRFLTQEDGNNNISEVNFLLENVQRDKIVALDTESPQPFRRHKQNHPNHPNPNVRKGTRACLIQICTKHFVFLIRDFEARQEEREEEENNKKASAAAAEYRQLIRAALRSILQDPNILKVGVAVENDVKELCSILCDPSSPSSPSSPAPPAAADATTATQQEQEEDEQQQVCPSRSVLDLQRAAKLSGLPRVGLQGLVAGLVKRKISKVFQCSAWDSRNLGRGQISYACTDAWSSLVVLQRMIQIGVILPFGSELLFCQSLQTEARRRRRRTKEDDDDDNLVDLFEGFYSTTTTTTKADRFQKRRNSTAAKNSNRDEKGEEGKGEKVDNNQQHQTNQRVLLQHSFERNLILRVTFKAEDRQEFFSSVADIHRLCRVYGDVREIRSMRKKGENDQKEEEQEEILFNSCTSAVVAERISSLLIPWIMQTKCRKIDLEIIRDEDVSQRLPSATLFPLIERSAFSSRVVGKKSSSPPSKTLLLHNSLNKVSIEGVRAFLTQAGFETSRDLLSVSPADSSSATTNSNSIIVETSSVDVAVKIVMKTSNSVIKFENEPKYFHVRFLFI